MSFNAYFIGFALTGSIINAFGRSFSLTPQYSESFIETPSSILDVKSFNLVFNLGHTFSNNFSLSSQCFSVFRENITNALNLFAKSIGAVSVLKSITFG